VLEEAGQVFQPERPHASHLLLELVVLLLDRRPPPQQAAPPPLDARELREVLVHGRPVVPHVRGVVPQEVLRQPNQGVEGRAAASAEAPGVRELVHVPGERVQALHHDGHDVPLHEVDVEVLRVLRQAGAVSPEHLLEEPGVELQVLEGLLPGPGH